MGRRRQAREFALQSLYLVDTGRMSVSDAMLIVSLRSRLDKGTEEFARRLAEGAAAHRREIDKHIQSFAKNWELGRMAAVDRNLLRMASFELIHHAETPSSVVIDEALEIAKLYSSRDSSKFINGILDKVKSLRNDQAREIGR